MKPDERRKREANLRLEWLKRRAGGYAIGFVLKPGSAVPYIKEPATTELQVSQAVRERLRRNGFTWEAEARDPHTGMRYADQTVASVWWRKVTGVNVVNGTRPRPPRGPDPRRTR